MFDLTAVEKNYVHKISAYSDVPEEIVKKVLIDGILKTFIAEFYLDNYTIFIPLIANCSVTYHNSEHKKNNDFCMVVNTVPCDSLKKSMIKIKNGEKTPNDQLTVKITPEEKKFIKKIIANSCVDEKSVYRVLLYGILKLFITEYFCGNNIVYIPYICKVKIDYYEEPGTKGYIKFYPTLEMTASKCLTSELSLIVDGEKPKMFDYIKRDIIIKLEELSA